MLPTPFGCREMARECCELLDEFYHDWMLGCPKMVSSGMASILPLTILVMAVTVVVIAAMVAPFVRYKE